jgi:hypothetical protein
MLSFISYDTFLILVALGYAVLLSVYFRFTHFLKETVRAERKKVSPCPRA